MLSDYIDDIVTTVTHDAYQNVPLANLSSKARGDLLENVVRRVIEDMTGVKTYEPDAGKTISGNKRARHQASFDFYASGRKCEVKSAQLKWNKHMNLFKAEFQNIKRNEYDDLYLALYTPSGIYIYKHDDKFGISTNGKEQESSGGNIIVCAPRHDSIEAATKAVLEKLQHMFIRHVSFDEIRTTTTVTHDAYQNVPLANLSSKVRGDLLENVVRRVLEEETGEKTCNPDAGKTIRGNKRGRNSSPFDFFAADRKCEVKSAQLGWDKHKKRFDANFQKVKQSEYDDLYLALYTPSGIYIYKHDDKFGISTNGKQQESSGGTINVYAPCHEDSIEAATKAVLEKLQHMLVKTVRY